MIKNSHKNGFVLDSVFVGFALLAVSATANAQSSVTIYEIMDATVMVGKGSLTNKNQLGHSGLQTSRLGFRGVEDLGGGLKAGFVLDRTYANH